jgi:hypothetical protein
MNLFRSEEHVRKWSGFKSGTEEGIVPLLDMAEVFSGSFFKRRLDADYVSHMEEYEKEVVGALQNRGAFWQVPRK